MFDLPDIMKEFQSIAGDFAKFRALMDKAQNSGVDEATKHYLTSLAKVMDQSFGELKQTLPDAVAYLAKTNAENQATFERNQAEAKELIKRFEEEQAKPPAAPAAPPARPPSVPAAPATPATLDADLRKYRLELLDLLNEDRAKAGEQPRKPDREIWQDWSKLEDK